MENICLLTRACDTTLPSQRFKVKDDVMTLIPINLNVLKAIGNNEPSTTIVSNNVGLPTVDANNVVNVSGLFIIDDNLMYTSPLLSKPGEDEKINDANATILHDKMLLYQAYHRTIFDQLKADANRVRSFIEMTDGYKRLKQVLYNGLRNFLRDDFKEVEDSPLYVTNGNFEYMFTLFYMASIKRMDLKGIFTNDRQMYESMVIFSQNMIVSMLNEYYGRMGVVPLDVLIEGLATFANITPYALSSLFKSYMLGNDTSSIVRYFVSGGADLNANSTIRDVDTMFWLKNKTEVSYSPAGDFATYSVNDVKYVAVLSPFNDAEQFTTMYQNYILVNIQPINREFLILQLREKEISTKVDVAIRSYDEHGLMIINYTNDRDMVELIKRGTRKAMITIARAACLDAHQFENLEGDAFRIYVKNLLLHYTEDCINSFSTGPVRLLSLLEYAPQYCISDGAVNALDIAPDQIADVQASFGIYNKIRSFVRNAITDIRSRTNTTISDDVILNDVCTLMSTEIMNLL